MASRLFFSVLLLCLCAAAVIGTARADQSPAPSAPTTTIDPTVLFEIFEPGAVPPGAENAAISYDFQHPLLVVRNLRSANLTDDGKGVIVQLNPADAKLLESLTTVYLNKFLILKAANDAGEVLHIVAPITDGVLSFRAPAQAPIANYLRERLQLKP